MKKNAPKWQRQLGKKLVAHIAENCAGPATLRALKANLEHQARTGARCFECEDAARRLGLPIPAGG